MSIMLLIACGLVDKTYENDGKIFKVYLVEAAMQVIITSLFRDQPIFG